MLILTNQKYRMHRKYMQIKTTDLLQPAVNAYIHSIWLHAEMAQPKHCPTWKKNPSKFPLKKYL